MKIPYNRVQSNNMSHWRENLKNSIDRQLFFLSLFCNEYFDELLGIWQLASASVL